MVNSLYFSYLDEPDFDILSRGYKNAMSMEDTVFSMNVADDGSFSGSASANFGSTRPGERFG